MVSITVGASSAESPAGSGVPVPDTIEESTASMSNVM